MNCKTGWPRARVSKVALFTLVENPSSWTEIAWQCDFSGTVRLSQQVEKRANYTMLNMKDFKQTEQREKKTQRKW